MARLSEFGEIVPVGRPGGQGRVYRSQHAPAGLSDGPVVVKLYRRPPSTRAAGALAEMIAWRRALDGDQRRQLDRLAAWPLAIVNGADGPVGIAMHDVSGRFEVPFTMPSGRRQPVLLSLEHLLGSDDYLELRGLGVRLDTRMRAAVVERISGALAFLHRRAVIVADIAPNNLLIGFGARGPAACFIDCDSMVFHGRQALAPVETADWQLPGEFTEPRGTRSADAYKLGLVALRLFARSHDARALAPHVAHVPRELRELLARSLGADPANRPPAGEWQRALRETLARGGLAERYPGPAPAIVRPRPVASRARPRRDAPPPRPIRPVRRPAPAAPPRRRASEPIALAWLVLAAVLLALVFARLLAAADSSTAGTSFPSQGSGQPNAPFQYYVPGQGDGSR